MKKILIPVLAVLTLVGCASQPAMGGGLKVAATTTLVGDVVRQVGGEHITLSVLLPAGADPHTFDPRPQDMAALGDAEVVFINGLGLEEALEPALNANAKGKVVAVSDGIEILPFESNHGGDEGEHAAGDPHTWSDPNNVKVWAQNIAVALAEADPANASSYQANADAYISELTDLDDWVLKQIEQIPQAQRKLVTDHSALAYFANAYGFEQIGLVLPALSTNAAPSAQELAALMEAIQKQGVRAIFAGMEVNPSTSRQVAEDTGVKLVPIYSGSLGEPGSGVENYIEWMHYNVQAIVNALK